jgi:hypothetical protein
MSGYVATARIRGVTPRLANAGRDPWASFAAAADGLQAPVELVAGAGDRLQVPPPTLAERWDAARERWAQLTFYLFSSEFWH